MKCQQSELKTTAYIETARQQRAIDFPTKQKSAASGVDVTCN